MMEISNRTIKWVENLADQELLIHSGKKGSFDIGFTKEEVLGAETSLFLNQLYHQFSHLIGLFNSRVSNNNLEIKMSRGGNCVEDFSLFRNYIKLSATRPQAGVVQLVCDKKMLDSPRSTVMFTGLIESKFGPFHDIEWHFLGGIVTAEQVACHYLTEFIQVSRAIVLDS